MTYLEMHWEAVVMLAAAGVAVVIVLWWLWWWLPKRQMRSITAADPKGRADIEDNFRKTVGQLLAVGGTVLAATAVLIGAASAYLQFTKQQQSSQDQFLKQQQAAHDLLISNQVSKGFEQFGSDNIRVRLGGIYALEGVMNTSEQYYRPVLEALSAFVRDSTQTVTGDGPPADDIQAALTVIGRRKVIGTGSPDLSNAHIPQAHLNNAGLAGAYLYNVDLHKGELNCGDLRSAQLNGANLDNVPLIDANLDDANLVGISLRGGSLSNAQLNRVNLIGADLRGTGLSGADITGAELRGAAFEPGQLQEACGTNVEVPGLKPCANRASRCPWRFTP